MRDLRLSVTDPANLRCNYCMPEDDYVWLPRDQILTFEEISTVVDAFISAGVEKLRLTGGEPLLRKGLSGLVEMLAGKRAIRDLAMTTNGVLFAKQAADLRAAGLGRVTISLDTLLPDRFEVLSAATRIGCGPCLACSRRGRLRRHEGGHGRDQRVQ